MTALNRACHLRIQLLAGLEMVDPRASYGWHVDQKAKENVPEFECKPL